MIQRYSQEPTAGQRIAAELTAVDPERYTGGYVAAVSGRPDDPQLAQRDSITGDAAAFSAADVCDAGPWSNAPPTAAKRSQMARVKTRHTAPELAVRRTMHARGLRFRLHRQDLPGRPDIVLPGRRIVVFVHGCYWHGCVMCDRGRRRPKSNAGAWATKLEENRRRDARNIAALKELGWHVVIIWECETRDPEKLAVALDRIHLFVPGRPQYDE
jgi:DNA mismatch endonuclease, patch repair protein